MFVSKKVDLSEVLTHYSHQRDGRGGSRIFSQGGSGGTQCHKDAAGVSGKGTEGGLGV